MRSKFQIPRRTRRHTRRRAFGALLLAWPLCGLALQPTPAQAQPAPTFQTPASPFSPEQKARFENVISVARNEEICKKALNITLQDATLDQLITQIKATFPAQQIVINQREARPVDVSLDLRETTVGTLLQSVATLAGCELWVLPDGLLIAPPGKLAAVEQTLVDEGLSGTWAENTQAGGHRWAASIAGKEIFGQAIVQETTSANMKADADGNIKTSFDAFSPESRAMLQQIVNWSNRSTPNSNSAVTPLMLTPDSPIEVNATDPTKITLRVRDGASTPASKALLMTVYLQNQPGQTPFVRSFGATK